MESNLLDVIVFLNLQRQYAWEAANSTQEMLNHGRSREGALSVENPGEPRCCRSDSLKTPRRSRPRRSMIIVCYAIILPFLCLSSASVPQDADSCMRKVHADDLKAFSAMHATRRTPPSHEAKTDPVRNSRDRDSDTHKQNKRMRLSRAELRDRGAPRLPRRKKDKLDQILAQQAGIRLGKGRAPQNMAPW
jgi:hypothetical protein